MLTVKMKMKSVAMRVKIFVSSRIFSCIFIIVLWDHFLQIFVKYFRIVLRNRLLFYHGTSLGLFF